MSKKAKVSIIVPLYNYEEYVEKAVRSLMQQTYGNIEIIVVDDGSTDNSGMIADRLAKEDERIKVVHQSNGGIGKALQTAQKMITGDYVAFLDSDDYMEADAYEELLKVALETNADIVEFGITAYDTEGIWMGIELPSPSKIIGNSEVINDYFFHDKRPHLSTKFVKASLFMNLDIMPYSSAIDEMTTLQILCYAEKIVKINKSYYNVIRNKQSVSRAIIDGNKLREQISAYKTFGEYIEKKNKTISTYFAVDIAKKYSVMYYRNKTEGFGKKSDVHNIESEMISAFNTAYKSIDFQIARGHYSGLDLLALGVFRIWPDLFCVLYRRVKHK